jgi:hypothetical protein
MPSGIHSAAEVIFEIARSLPVFLNEQSTLHWRKGRSESNLKHNKK